MAKEHIYERAFDYPTPTAFVGDDEPQVRALVSIVLANAGCKPMQCASSGEVEAALRDVIPQAIILDLSLGDSDAIEVLRMLSGMHFQGDVLLISGHDEATLEEEHTIGERRGINMLEPLRTPFRVGPLRGWL